MLILYANEDTHVHTRVLNFTNCFVYFCLQSLLLTSRLHIVLFSFLNTAQKLHTQWRNLSMHIFLLCTSWQPNNILCNNFNLLCDIQIPNDKILSHILPSLISLSVSPKNYIHSENHDVGFEISDCLNHLFFLIVEDASQYIKSVEPILSLN